MTSTDATPRSRAARPDRATRRRARDQEQLRKMRTKAGNRYRIHYDIDGPRVRLGVAWFLGACVAFALGVLGVTLYFGIAFAAAGSHALRTWRARGVPADPRIALAATAAVILGAAAGPQAMGVALVAVTAIVVLVSAGVAEDGSPVEGLRTVGFVLQAALPAAVAGGCFVLLFRLETWAAISLVLLVSAYETGDYLIGSGAANAAEGPLAGSVAVLVVTLAIAALGFPPFDVGEALLFGVAVGPMAVLGQLAGSVMLPHARAFAPALRRVDSLLLAAPLWYAGVDLFVL